MASGWYDFVAGAIPTAAQWDDFISKQVNMVFATESARDTALATPLREGMVTYTEDTNTIWVYDGTGHRIVFRTLTAYTPAIGGSGWSIGTTGSSATGNYSVAGRRVTFEASLTFGTAGATFGAGSPTVSLPVTSAAATAGRCGAQVMLGDTGTGTHVGVGSVGSTTVTIERQNISGSNSTVGTVTSTTPFTWAAGDTIQVAGWYWV